MSGRFGFRVALCVMGSLAFVAVAAEEPAMAPLASPPVETGPAPKIVFDSILVNLGDVVHGENAAATFTFHNTGDAPLHILGAKPG
jgi:hypothetical protein